MVPTQFENTVPTLHWNEYILISLHIHSMWEIICDALASWSGWKFGSKIPVYPILGFGSPEYPPPPTKFEILSFDHWRIPPPPNWNLGRSWHFKTFQFWPPENTPLPPNWNLGRSWHFKTFQFWPPENTPPPPKKNSGRSWHFKTFQFWPPENTPPPPAKHFSKEEYSCSCVGYRYYKNCFHCLVVIMVWFPWNVLTLALSIQVSPLLITEG